MNYEAFVNELTLYMHESAQRGNKVISIAGVLDILKRHQTSVNKLFNHPESTEEHLLYRNERRLRLAYTKSDDMSVTTH